MRDLTTDEAIDMFEGVVRTATGSNYSLDSHKRRGGGRVSSLVGFEDPETTRRAYRQLRTDVRGEFAGTNWKLSVQDPEIPNLIEIERIGQEPARAPAIIADIDVPSLLWKAAFLAAGFALGRLSSRP